MDGGLHITFERVHPDARLPERQTPADSGYAIFAVEDCHVPLNGAVVRTGLNISSISPNFYPEIQPAPHILHLVRGFTSYTQTETMHGPAWNGLGVFSANAEIMVKFEWQVYDGSFHIRKGDQIAVIYYKPFVHPVQKWKQ